MAKIINLRQRRKQQKRETERRLGDEAAAKHGVPKAERLLRSTEERRESQKLDGHRLDPPEE